MDFKKVLLLSAHPDDAEIGAGGTVQFLNRNGAVIDHLVKSGIPLQRVPDPVLLEETREWYKMKTTTPNQVITDLYEASLKETSQQIVNAVDLTLKEGEVGVLLIDPNIQIAFPENYRIIRMLPFNPIDYLNRQMIKHRV